MKRVFNATPGVSLPAISLQGGAYIRGIEVDNPSGSWLYIPVENVFVPPYTLGWSIATTGGRSSVDVMATGGPAGQISTQAGDPITVTISDSPVSASKGQQSFAATGSTPVLRALWTFLPPGGAIEQIIPPPLAGRRIVIWTVDASLEYLPVNAVAAIYCGLTSGGISCAYMVMDNPYRRAEHLNFPQGFPLDIGLDFSGIVLDATGLFINVNIVATYSIV